MRIRRSSRTTRLVAGVAGLGVAVGAIIIAHPAGASTTVEAQLSLSGVATRTAPTGGSVVGIHPGDSVDLKPSAIPLAGLNALGGLGDALTGLLSGLTGFQVVLHHGSLPGLTHDITLGSCGGQPDQKVTFPKAGTYTFTWSAKSFGLLGCLTPVELDGNQLQKYGVALKTSTEWIGKVVVATDPPSGGLSVQLPGISVAPSVGGVQLPTVGVPGANLPTIPVVPPSLNPGLPTGSKPSTPTDGSSGSGGINYTPPGGLIQDSVVPKGYGPDEGSGHNPDAALNSVLLNGLHGGTGAVPNSLSGGAVQGNSGGQAPPVPIRSGQPIDLAANRAPAGQMPVLLAILAIIALSLVTATYARLYLMRRNTA